MGSEPAAEILALPMHGEVKLRREGLRTRDAHLLEWLARRGHRVRVQSRPEPWPRVRLARLGRHRLPAAFELISPEPKTAPPLRDRRRWWVESLRHRREWPSHAAAVGWNPLEVARALERREATGPLVFDLLDDWLAHPAFAGIRTDVEAAYRLVLSSADAVTANSEGTAALAARFGRRAELIPNGVDPERFSQVQAPAARLTIGYGGKIGSRLDVELISEAASALPRASFEFAGPVLDRRVGRALRRIGNVTMVGDVHYDDYPSLLRRWDLAWAPHRVGEGEVGGDAIKLYEYRAAGLPTFSTRIVGWDRALEGVRTPATPAFVDAMVGFAGDATAGELAREPVAIPRTATWAHKADRFRQLLGIASSSDESAVAP